MIALKHPCRTCGHNCHPESQNDCEQVKQYVKSIGPLGLSYENQPTFQTVDSKEVVDMGNPQVAADQENTKICDHPNCVQKNKPQPIENFRSDRRCADGRRSICNDCLDMIGAGRKSPSVKIPLDIWRKLEAVAKHEMREPDKQLLYLIVDAYESRQPKKEAV